MNLLTAIIFCLFFIGIVDTWALWVAFFTEAIGPFSYVIVPFIYDLMEVHWENRGKPKRKLTPKELLAGVTTQHWLFPWQVGLRGGVEQPVAIQRFIRGRDHIYFATKGYDLSQIVAAIGASVDSQIWVRYKVKLPVFSKFDMFTKVVGWKHDKEKGRTHVYLEQKFILRGVTYTHSFCKMVHLTDQEGTNEWNGLFKSSSPPLPKAWELWLSAENAASEKKE